MVQGGVNGNPALISTGFTPVRPIFDGERKGGFSHSLSLFQRKYSNKRNQARFLRHRKIVPQFSVVFRPFIVSVGNFWPDLTAISVKKFRPAGFMNIITEYNNFVLCRSLTPHLSSFLPLLYLNLVPKLKRASKFSKNPGPSSF